jgi:signal transduction histidine kinase
MCSAATRSTKPRLGPRVFSDRHAGRPAGELLDHQVALCLREERLVLEVLVTLDDEEALGIGADLLVRLKRHADVLDARAVPALADELGLLGDDAETLSEFTQPLVHLPEHGFVHADPLSALIHPSHYGFGKVPSVRFGSKASWNHLIVAERVRQETAEREFVTNAAHELQSPLTAIVSAIEVLQAGAKDTPERDVFLGHIERASARLARLARALLVLARAQTGAESPKTELVSLEALLADVGSWLKTAEKVRVDVSCPPEAAVITNRELVEQAVFNVAENAAKYTAVGRIELAARVVDGRAEISISDTGPGISRAEQRHVFERFYRGGSSPDEGSGLGLSIARAAAEALGGEVELESAVGKGTVVRFRLPQGASLVEQ